MERRVAIVVHLLTRGEVLGLGAAGGEVLAGAVLTLVGPLVLASLVKSIALRSGADTVPSFAATFSLACFVLVPVLLWLERRSRGRFFEDAVRGESGTRGASSYGEYKSPAAKFLLTACVEVALLGPRLLWHVYDWARGTLAVPTPVRTLAAEVVVELLEAGEGLPVRRLVRTERPAAQLQCAIHYLVQRDWADVSRRRDRVWLLTPVRQRLQRELRNLDPA